MKNEREKLRIPGKKPSAFLFQPQTAQKRRYCPINSHLYHYAGNNPVKYIDPDGRASILQRSINKGKKKTYNSANWFGNNTGLFLHGLVDYGDLTSTNKVSQLSGEQAGITTNDNATQTRMYKIIYTEMDDTLTEQAVTIVNNSEKFGSGNTKGLGNGGGENSAGGKYKIFLNDCNDYTNAVFNEYKKLWQENYKTVHGGVSEKDINKAWQLHKKDISSRKGEYIEIPRD